MDFTYNSSDEFIIMIIYPVSVLTGLIEINIHCFIPKPLKLNAKITEAHFWKELFIRLLVFNTQGSVTAMIHSN